MLSTARRIALVLVIGLSVGAGAKVAAQSRGATPAKRPLISQKRPLISIAVLPFRQSIGSPDTEALGAGISDSLSNALKAVDSVVVADTKVLEQTAAKAPNLDILRSDEDAATVGEQVGVALLIAGSYQAVGDQIVVDARILNVATKTVLPGSAVSSTVTFPAGYGGLLKDLATRLVAAMKIPLSPTASKAVTGSLVTSNSGAAVTLYNRGIAKLQSDTRETIQQAIDDFEECLRADPAYSLAYAAKAEAETRLAELTRLGGVGAGDLAAKAVEDAQLATRRIPSSSRAHRALAHAQNVAGDYTDAAVAARRALLLSPNDADATIALNQAVNRGQIVRSAELDRTLQIQPWLAFVVSVFPKVIVHNQTNYELTITVAPKDGGIPYPVVRVQPHALKVMALMPGKFTVTFDCASGQVAKDYEFVSNSDYEVTLEATDIVTTKVRVGNRGNSTAYVTFNAPKWSKSVTVNPGEQSQFELQSGQYQVNCAGAPSGSGDVSTRTLPPNSETSFECNVTRTYRTVRRAP